MSDFIEKLLNIEGVDILGLSVETQRTYGKLENHEVDWRSHIVIEFFNPVDKYEYIVFIESKIGAQEGYQQLQRYGEHLINIKIVIFI